MTEEGNRFNAKTAREQFSAKLDTNIGTIQKHLVKGIEKWIGDCNGMIPSYLLILSSSQYLIIYSYIY
jgi:hypothetical protein